MSEVDAIMEQVATLTPEQREELRIRLLEAARRPEHSDANAAWGSELARRVEAFTNGEIEVASGEDVLREMDELLESRRA